MTAHIPLRDGLLLELREHEIWLHIPVSIYGIMALQITTANGEPTMLRSSLERWCAMPVDALWVCPHCGPHGQLKGEPDRHRPRCVGCGRLAEAVPSVPLNPQPVAQKSANDHQVGGDHYKKRGIQPWDFIAANCLDWFTGEIVKYITRWRDKGGVADLEKARHVLDKYIETEKAKST